MKLKPGVLFRETRSGGVLLDVQADRFVALSPLSAAIWRAFADGGAEAAAGEIAQVKRVTREVALRVLHDQLRRWDRADLVTASGERTLLPGWETPAAPATRELPLDEVLAARVHPMIAAELLLLERRYRRRLAKRGLAATLLVLQGEGRSDRRAPVAVLRSLMRSYHALRRGFRQGLTAHDCLFRSLALSAALRRRQFQAHLCIGIVDLPFSSHAWVETGNWVLNETLDRRNEYVTMGRF